MKKFNTLFIGWLVFFTGLAFQALHLVPSWDMRLSAFLGVIAGILYLTQTYGITRAINIFMVRSFHVFLPFLAFMGLIHPGWLLGIMLTIHIGNTIIGVAIAMSKIDIKNLNDKSQIIEVFGEE